MTAALILKIAALVVVFMAGRAWEARDRLRTLEQNEQWTGRDLKRALGERTGLLP